MNKQSTIEGVYDGLLEAVRKVDNFPKPKITPNAVVFKMRHKPSGLFALSAESKYTEYSLIKLSVDGKLYVKAPKLPDSAFCVVYPRKFDASSFDEDSEPKDWELVSYELKEIKQGV